MSEKEEIFSSSVKYTGYFSFKEFYLFCHEWLTEETDLGLEESKYVEKLKGTSKDIEIKWVGVKKLTDYFRFDMKVKFTVRGLKEVEMKKGDRKFKSNEGSIKIDVKSTLVRDYEGKFERTAFRKFWRAVYEKWIIPSRIEQFEDKIISNSNEFLSQAKAWLDLEGKKG